MTSKDASGALVAGLVDRMGLVVIGLGTVMLALLIGSAVVLPKPGGRIISGDAVHHFVQLRSLVYDHDLDFANEYTRVYRFDHADGPTPDWHALLPTPTGRIRNYMPIGPALLWAPLYLLISGILAAAAAAGWTTPPDGFEPILQMVPGITGVIAAATSAWLAWRLAARLTDRTSAAIGMLGVWLGSNALYYSLVSPSYSHSASMCASALFLTHWIARRDRWTVPQAALSGALAGVATLMRWQDALWLVVPVIESVRASGRPIDRAGRLLAVGAAWVLAVAPQLAVWQVLYGSPLTVPQGSGFIEWWEPNLLAVLATRHGLFTWSPVLVLAVAGLVPFFRSHRSLALPLALVVLGSWYINSAVADWWGGEAFGARRFLSLFPLFVVGLASWTRTALLAGWRRATWLVAALVIANGLLLFQYQLFMRGWRTLAPYPDSSWVNLWLMRFVVPFRVLARWIG
jgi:hypothetical protein